MIAHDRQASKAALDAVAAGNFGALAPDVEIDACHPWGRLTGTAAPWQALRRAMPDMERRDTIFLAGENAPDERTTDWRAPHIVACLGSYIGTFREPLVGIPPTQGVARLDYGEAHWIEGGVIRASWLVWDIAGLMVQTGCWPMAAPVGAPGHWPGPAPCDGLRMAPTPGDQGQSLTSVLEMHAILNEYKNGPIDEIDMRHWHPDFMYWAAGGIGACRGIEGFRAHHQIPYRRAFAPVRSNGHFVRLSDGPYAATGGPLTVTHSGGDWLGMAPTGRDLRFQVMDFYRLNEDGLIVENWLPNDTLGVLADMGVDVLARLAHLQGSPRRTL